MTNMEQKRNYIEHVFFIVAGIYIAFLHLFTKDIIFYGVFFCILFRYIYRAKQITTNGILLWAMPIMYMILSIVKSYSAYSGLKYSIVMVEFWLLAVFLANSRNWTGIYSRYISFVLWIHVFYTLFSIFFKEISLKISSYILTGEMQYLSERWIRENNHYAGISGQTGINAFFFSILLSINVSKILCGERKLKNYVYLILVFVVLVATGKKASIAMNAVAMIFCILVYCNAKGKSIKKYIAVIAGIGGFSLFLLPILKWEMVSKFMGTSVISRMRIFETVWKLFLEHPLLGNGVDSVGYYVGHSAHNSYVQLLCEYGLLGTFFYLLPILFIFVDTWKQATIGIKLESLEKKEKSILLMSFYYQIYFLLTGFFESTLFNYRMIFIYFIVVAGMYSVARNNSR